MPNIALTDYYENGVESFSSDFFKACSALGLDKELRLFACRCVRDTPLPDSRKVWDLLTDERSRKAVEVAEWFANGQATDQELDAAMWAAKNAYLTAVDATYLAAAMPAHWAASMAAYWTTDWVAASAADCVAYWTADSAADSVAERSRFLAAERPEPWATTRAAARAAHHTFLRETLPLDTFLAAAEAKSITEPTQLFPTA